MDVAQGASQLPANVATYGYGAQSAFNGSDGQALDSITTSFNGGVTPPSIVKNEANGIDAVGRSIKLKQKRNKPTLSCLECVERKASRYSFQKRVSLTCHL